MTATDSSVSARLSGVALLDRQLTPSVRVRRWHQRGAAPRFPPAEHGALEVAWVLDGHVTYKIGRRTHQVRQGQAMVVPVGVGHETGMDPGTRAGSTWLDRALVAEVSDACGSRPPSDADVVGDGAAISAVGELIAREALEAGPGHMLCAEALAEALVVALLRAAPARQSRTARDPRIAAALDRIHTEYAEPIGVEDLAAAAGMSRYHFSRLFREQVGSSPYRYLMRIRVERAAELLRGGRCSVTEAAISVGFHDLGRFGRAFRERFGHPPSLHAGRQSARSADRSARSA